jgi:retron-type reverse transcriptase
MLGMSISTMAMTTTTIRQIRIMFGVCEIVKMFSFDNIYRCYKMAKKNKSTKFNTLEFESDLLGNLWKLHYELNSKTYKVGKYLCFIRHSPKMREIFASDFRDRIVQQILVEELEKFYEPKFIYDVYNNRKNKGIHSAIKRAQSFMHRYQKGYYMQLDIKGFFYNIDKNILFPS